ncbi:hypothetical protein [Ramlibacter pallidus]|uniref:Uncharacterized protein n=1 Tax=Ramlibacter pallidus TaxID=2780087 RepID=A0ABR9S1A7_9BURK|nr:hypothetical protein [Ramlibacter pallidus]MBE7367288.1 hypothetical protein [Ramlibacter pallidus]
MSTSRTVERARGWLLAAAAAAAAAPAGAVFTFTPLDTPREVTLQVGSPGNLVNEVRFTVNNAAVAPNPVPVTGIPSNNTPNTSPAGGVEIIVTTRMPPSVFGSDTMTLTVDSTQGLACVGGSGCGTTVIPFTTIGWTSYNTDPSGQDIQAGTFNATATQQLATYTVYTGFPWTGQSVNMRNVLVFRYDNATLYPSGTYEGRVVYTATNL